MRYDPMDTARWMLDGLRWSLSQETSTGANGKPKKKTKAQLAEEQLRAATLVELMWNVEGRPGDLEAFTERLAA